MDLTKIEINEEFGKALSFLENSNKNLFITGNAGTGKSTLLEHFRNISKKKIAVLAPTGVAALNVNGQTIHSFFLIPPNITPEKVLDHKLSKKRIKLIQSLDTIIIDEASMLRADLLDCIDISLRHHRNNKYEAFGGLQMVFIGDLYQLPPIVAGPEEKQLFQTHYSSPYFFSAKCLEETEVKFMELKKIYRQKDQKFIELLNKIRENTVQAEDLNQLNKKYNPSKCETNDFVITLNTTNSHADEKNMKELNKLNSKSQKFFGEIEGDFKKQNLPTLKELELREGAQVMLLNNDPAGRWVNGSIGKITKINLNELEKNNTIEVKLNTGKTVKIAKHSWNIHRYFYNEEKKAIDTETIGSFTQFPLRLAWAVTIHKSQGKTFEKVIIDIGNGTFSSGQIYVALSRCTNLEGITLKKPIQQRHIWLDRQVTQFFKQLKRTQAHNPPESKENIQSPTIKHKKTSPKKHTYSAW